MRLLLLVLACMSIWLCEYRHAWSQNAGPDRPSQRWLPPPQGGQNHVIDQLRLLEQLRSQVAAEPAEAPIPELTEEQLQQLDQAYKAWMEHSGGAQLPDWNSVPKEWIDQALANPEQLQQAQRLIQQYARQRKLQLPDSLPGSPQGLKMPGSEPGNSAPGSSTRQRSAAERSEPRGSELEGSPTQDDLQQLRPGADSSPSAENQPTGAAMPPERPANPSSVKGQRNGSFSEDASQTGWLSADALQRGLSGSAPQPPSAEASQPAANRSTISKAEASRAGGSLNRAASRNDNASAAEPRNPDADVPDAPDATEALPSGAASDAASKALSNRTAGQSDAAQLQALKELFEKLKDVQAARNAADVQSSGRSNDRRVAGSSSGQTRDSARNLDAARQANAQRNASGRDPRRSNSPPRAPAPRNPGGPLAGSPMRPSQQPLAPRSPTDRQRPTPGPESADELRDASDNTIAQSSESADQAGSSDASSFDALDSQGEGTLFEPPLAQSAAGTGRSRTTTGETLNSAGLRSATRSSTIQPSLSGGWPSSNAPYRRTGAADSGAAHTAESAAGTFRLPQIDTHSSAGQPSVNSESAIQAKIKRDVEQFGWRRALHRIIEDTFKDDPGAASSAGAGSTLTGSTLTGSNRVNSLEVKPAKVSRSDESWVARKLSEAGRTVPRTLSVNATAASKTVPDMLSNSGFASTVADIWKAIANTPLSEDIARSSPEPSSPRSPRKWKWNGKWDAAENQVGIVFMMITVVALAVWVSRKRSGLLRADRAVDTRWAKEVLAEGIRTRADVIRAFHRFVAHAAEPVASWWTHRFVAGRLVAATPQLSTALEDLSSVYEQARYMPPEVELSAEQITRVCRALQECVAYGNSVAASS